MKKLDEMGRNIQLRSQEWGYRAALLMLGAWTFFNCWQTLKNGAAYHPLPGLILCLAVCVQGFSQMVLRRKMVAGDEEYREPNRPLWGVVAAVVAAAIILAAGTYLITRI